MISYIIIINIVPCTLYGYVCTFENSKKKKTAPRVIVKNNIVEPRACRRA